MNLTCDVGIVIPTWNSASLLPECLDSVVAQGDGVELLVVDNGSTDGTVELLRERRVPHLVLSRNTGFAAAVNLGVARLEAPVVMPLNADAILERGAVRVLLGRLREEQGAGGVQPRILQLEGERGDPNNARMYSAGQALTVDGRAIELGAGEPQSRESGRAREVFGVCGAACLLRRELFDELGGYDETYFSFYEDVDLNVRARIAGWRFFYEPAATAWHLGNASWLATAPAPGPWNARLVARNRIVTQAKFVPARALPRIVAAEFGALGRAATQRRLAATFRGKVEGLRRLRYGMSERRRLRHTGKPELARRWLGA